MEKAKASVFLAALVLGAGLCMGPAAAGEPADDLASWGAVSTAELEQYRGGDTDVDGAAVATATQTVENDFDTGGGAVTTGAINAPDSALANQTMVINAFNTGNNVSMQNTMAIMVIID